MKSKRTQRVVRRANLEDGLKEPHTRCDRIADRRRFESGLDALRRDRGRRADRHRACEVRRVPLAP